MKYLYLLALLVSGCGGGSIQQASLPTRLNVVFIGDSLTARWDLETYFPGKAYVNKGVSGETSTQVLARFQADVIALHPDEVLILIGINDIMRGTLLDTVESNISAMVSAAKSAGIKPIVCTVLPVGPSIAAYNTQIVMLDTWIRSQQVTVSDYYSAIQQGGMLPSALTIGDDLHVNAAGYTVMSGVVSQVIN